MSSQRPERLLVILIATMLLVWQLSPVVTGFFLAFSNEDSIGAVPGSFTLSHFASIAADRRWRDALLNSLMIASLASVLSSTAGLLLAASVASLRSKGIKVVLSLLICSHVFTPPVLLGVANKVFLTRLGLADTVPGLVLAYALLCLVNGYLLCFMGLGLIRQAEFVLVRASGGGIWACLRECVLPRLVPFWVAATGLNFAVCMDESVISLFVSQVDTPTLPKLIWTSLRYSATPEAAAAAVCSFLAVLSILLLAGIGTLSVSRWAVRSKG